MELVDSQLHPSDLDSHEYPWNPSFLSGLSGEDRSRFESVSVPTERIVSIMDQADVAAAVLVSRGVTYGEDHRYAFAAANRNPGRFGVVGPLKPDTPNVEERIRTYRDQPYGLGVRVLLLPNSKERVGDEGYRRMFSVAEKAEVPMFFTVMGRIQDLNQIARDFPNMLMVLDHFGLYTLEKNVDPFNSLPDVLRLAHHDNVTVKLSAGPLLTREDYPFSDLWPTIHRILDAYGVRRLMWGTDITTHLDRVTYQQAVDYVRMSDELSDHEKEQIMGANLRRLLRWPRTE
jgi:L-fuconolactonase